MGRTFYTCNINKTGLLHLLRHASPRLYNFIIADNPDHSLLYHFLNENEKKLQDLKNDSIKFEDNFITIYNPCKEFVDKCPDINILQLLKLLSNADIFIVLNNLISKRSDKPHIIQAATILLAVMSLTEYSPEKLEQLNVLLNLCPKNGFQICLKYKEPTDHWITGKILIN
uniref:Uncharacterized protein n=1 Tax=Panagrolaimus davidi TaxID=227884 RepID=A0A914QQX1_9BILA